jgi:hypothetical protein
MNQVRWIERARQVRSALVLVLALGLLAAPALATELNVTTTEQGTSLALVAGNAFHTTTQPVLDAELIAVPGEAVRVVTWREQQPDGSETPFYAISMDGQNIDTVRETSYMLRLRYGDFEPLGMTSPVAPLLASDNTTNLYIVQFVSQPLEVYRDQVAGLGGTVYTWLAHHAHIVRMSPDVRDQVEQLPYVRWVGPYHPAYRLEEVVVDNADQGDKLFPLQRYNIQVFESGLGQKQAVADQLADLGAKVDRLNADKYLLEATLTPEQLFAAAHFDEVLFIDHWSPMQEDMNIARDQGGANYLETMAGYDGEGVRGEVFDGGFNLNHVDFQSRPLLVHGSAGSASHGASTSGICFGDGTGDPTARGLLPAGQGIVANYSGLLGEPANRYTHTAELLEAPYYAVFQTSSVGSDRTTEYTTLSAAMDTMLFDLDILHCQSQSNAGSRMSRPQAWAKNIVSGGAINHFNTLDRSDDCWCSDASIGPASDGRIKPDLCGYYDDIRTVTCCGSESYTNGFGGTSGGTPIVCGHIGLFFDMWADGVFGNEVDPEGTVFENRSHMTTAKAVMINTAEPYPFSGTTHDLTRVHQGWGWPDLGYLWDSRDNMSIIDETDLITNLETKDYSAVISAGTPELRVTLVYADPAGVPASSVHRINDLSLRVVSPTGDTYYGNNGLLAGNWSTPGGSANTVDTVENVFVQNPAVGLWEISVIAAEINQDGHVETIDLDADYALVVSGAKISVCTSAGRLTADRALYPCDGEVALRVIDCDLNLDDLLIEDATITIYSTSEPGGETVTVTETAEATADFRGSILLSTVDAPGVLQVAEGDTITVVYLDEDDGEGHQNVEVTVEALVDCMPPVISNVVELDVTTQDALIGFQTDEPTIGSVRWGFSCGNLTESETQPGMGTDHEVVLTGLTEETTYYYVVDAEDEAGNMATDDNGGACYSFETPDIPTYFTQEMLGFDLANNSVLFTPEPGVDFYGACTQSIFQLPTNPAGGNVLALEDDDFQEITVGGGEVVSLYGTAYGSFFVGSNGYITFTAGDDTYLESLAEHFSLPRISALFDDLNPEANGQISWKQTEDRVAVTWQNIPEYSNVGANTFQIEMFFDGSIRISWLNISCNDSIIGLSAGEDVPELYAETDISALIDCSEVPSLEIVSAMPPSGAIDARQPHERDAIEPAYGWTEFEITFDGDVSSLTGADFEVTQEGGVGAAPAVDFVEVIDVDTIRLVLDEPLNPVAWTTITHIDSQTAVTYGYLPADVNGDGVSNSFDVLSLIDHLNAIISLPVYSTDLDRGGETNSFDVLVGIDLLNGAELFEEYNEVSLP